MIGNESDTMECMSLWCDYLEKNLQFPITATIDDDECDIDEEKFTFSELDTTDDLYGIVGCGKISRRKVVFPLCRLKLNK